MGGLLKLLYCANQSQIPYIKKTGASTFTVKTNEITRQHLILCSSISEKWLKTLKTPNKEAGPVGKEGVLGGVNRCRNEGKSTKT